jgi:hypothetical protein
METTILIIVSLLFLWLTYDLIKSRKISKEQNDKQNPLLSYGDKVYYIERTEDGLKVTTAMVVRQNKSRVIIRTDDDMKIWNVARENLSLIDNKNNVLK